VGIIKMVDREKDYAFVIYKEGKEKKKKLIII